MASVDGTDAIIPKSGPFSAGFVDKTRLRTRSGGPSHADTRPQSVTSIRHPFAFDCGSSEENGMKHKPHALMM